MNFLESFEWAPDTGEKVVSLILSLAAWLTGEGAPGLVSLLMLATLIGLSGWYLVIMLSFVSAVGSVKRTLSGGSDGKITQDHLIDINRHLKQESEKGGFRKSLARAWQEFNETALPPSAEAGILRNTVRPVVFFNIDDLRLEGRIWRQVPALFVSVGLLLTFLGLVAALEQTGNVLNTNPSDASASVQGLRTLLKIASAKFIMSLTGLFCSIVFTVLLRFCAKKKDRALQEICSVIERGCDFMSEQDVLREMLTEIKEQTGHLQTFSTELVAQIAQPLKEDLPNAIRESVGEAIQPVIDSIARDTNQGIESLVGSVSGQLVEGVDGSVREISSLMEAVCSRLEEAAGRLDRSSATVTTNVDEAVGTLVTSVEKLTGKINHSSEKFGMYAESLGASSDVVSSSSEQLHRSSETLSGATDTMRQSITDIQASTQAIKGSAEQTESILRHAHDAIMASHAAVQVGLASLDRSVSEFRKVIEHYREIDQHLGDAFTRIESDLRASVQEIGDFEKKINENLAQSLNQLQAVISQAEPFIPAPEE